MFRWCKKMFIKRYVVIFLMCLPICSGCTGKRTLQICDVLESRLQSSGIKNSKILSLGDFSVLSYEVEDVQLSETELQQAVSDIMETYSRLLDDTQKVIVEKGDFVTIRYESICEGKVIDSNREKVLKVGAGFFDKSIEESLIGALKGETYSIKIVIPEGEGILSGKEETTTITVEKIQYIEEEKLTDEFVKENYDLDNVEEFYKYVKNQKEFQMRQKNEIEASNRLMEQAIQLCDFALDEDEVLKVALDIYEEYEYAAHTYGISAEEYINTFMDVSGDVYEECFSEAEEKIKYELMIGAIAYNKNITGGGDDFNIWLEKKNIVSDGVSEEDLQYYKKEYLETVVKEHLIKE